jgi:hypothetical protein
MKAPDPTDPPASATDVREDRADLERLGNELGPLGCKTVLVSRDGRPPFLDVLHPAHLGKFAARVHAQADFFWWPTGRVIAARDRVGVAAAVIARSLGVAGGQR